ncbi:MAG: glycosyltransferase family 4 protein [Candidatus Magasanikbacteria bacterium]|jgi:glycosyltransferase involved in cell wall biosynthesis|nr:glycosyltransferase family 4 protein [Candidatus Magasanikbacteria bacterium]
MKIAHIVCTFPPYHGGMGNVAFEMVRHQLERGDDVRVYTPNYYEPKEIKAADEVPEEVHAEELTEMEETVHRLAPTLKYGNAARMSSLKDELEDVDLVHLHYPFFGTAGMVKKWREAHRDKRLVVSYHMESRAKGWKGMIFDIYAAIYMPQVLQTADAIVASSFEYVRSTKAARYLAKRPEAWHELPFGVDTDRFSPHYVTDHLYKKHALHANTPVLLFVGGMDSAHAFKGIETLLKALSTLKRTEQQMPQVVLVGDGNLRRKYMLMSKGMGLSRYVRFAGRISDEELPEYYAFADAVVLPSDNAAEAFGMVLIEAYASGTPVIASDLPGVRTVATHAGTVFPAKDAPALAKVITEFMALPPARIEQLKHDARQAAEQVYQWPRVAEELDIIYKNCFKS